MCKMSLAAPPVLALLALLACACTVPDGYVMTLTVDHDTCLVEYSGRFHCVVAAMMARDKGAADAHVRNEAMAAMKEFEAAVLRLGGRVETRYVSGDAFEADFSLTADLGESRQVDVLDMVLLGRTPSGTLTVRGVSVSDADRKNLAGLAVQSRGELRVKTGGTVLGDNAQDKPGMLSDFYSWKLDIAKDTPVFIEIR